jgi:hypothetical protein
MIRRTALIGAVCLWIAAVCLGMGWLWSYNQAAGAPGQPPEVWPKQASVSLDSTKFTLVLLAHPQCPCTRATVEELSKLMTNCQGRINAYVLFAIPQSAPADWYKTDLWSSAAMIPGVTTIVDPDGTIASRFGAQTSGQVVLYDRDGELRFRGGITQSRGHVGDNAGRSAIEAIVNNGDTQIDHTGVFGCPLFNPDSECRVPNHGNDSKQK